MSPSPSPSDIIEQAYDEYADAIFRHCYLRLLNRELAKDLMQDTFIKAFQYLEKGNTVEHLRALLYRIAGNLVIDHVRRMKETSLDALQEAGFDPTGSDAEDLGDRLDDKRVTRALAQMPREDRDLVVLRFVDGFKPHEIADMLGLSPNVTSVRLHRALKAMKVILKQP